MTTKRVGECWDRAARAVDEEQRKAGRRRVERLWATGHDHSRRLPISPQFHDSTFEVARWSSARVESNGRRSKCASPAGRRTPREKAAARSSCARCRRHTINDDTAVRSPLYYSCRCAARRRLDGVSAAVSRTCKKHASSGIVKQSARGARRPKVGRNATASSCSSARAPC